MKNTRVIPDGHEIRGNRFRVYPMRDQAETLRLIQEAQRRVWNWLVARRDEDYRARCKWVERQGLIEPYESLDAYCLRTGTPRPEHAPETEADSAALEVWRVAERAWRKQTGERAARMKSLLAKHRPTVPEYKRIKEWCAHFGVKQDYQLFQIVSAWYWETPPRVDAWVWQALAKSYLDSKGIKRKRKRPEDMPVRVRSGPAIKFGAFGERRGNPFYNSQVAINGMKIRARVHRMPQGEILQGVALTQEADGWYAAIKEVLPVRVPPQSTAHAVGVDVGLIDLLAEVGTDGHEYLQTNERNSAYTVMLAGLQALGKDTSRLQQQARRYVHDKLHCAVSRLSRYAFVFIERLPADIGQRGTRHVSVMRTFRAFLIARLGDRVREVEPAYTSQDCSQCGHRSKETWSCANGRHGHCPACGYRDHRDLNAARNILRRGLESLCREAA